jgi:gp178|nr:MAG TPA: Protein of unknown function (DUF1642) [Caudoviricetes sp.]
MNKQELIEKYKELANSSFDIAAVVACQLVLKDLEQLDEPEKVKVPPFVSVWYRINKDNLYKNIAYLCANWVKSTTTDNVLFNWMSNTDNFIEILINMHKFGYEVEKEKRYLVKVKGVNGYGCYLNKGLSSKEYFFESKAEIGGCRTKHTRKQLEDGFGWVFDCEGIEVKEVEE